MNKKEEKNNDVVTAGEAINYRDSWRIFKIISEFVEGYHFLEDLTREVTILGSARFPANNKYYKIAQELGQLLGKNKFTVITGGGPGIMEAGNKGAHQAGGQSVGLNIQLPFEQRINPYVNKSVAFYYFFTRKVMLTSPAMAFVFFPGGFGTLDEFFEVIDYMELGQMNKSPIVLVGKDYWNPLLNFLRKKSAQEVHSISENDIDSWHVVDTAKEAYEFIKNAKEHPRICEKGSDLALCQGGLNWRMFRIMSELVDGFEFLTKTKNDVTILGTKTIEPGTKYYKDAYEIGKILVKNKFSVVTGGGQGVMEAASKGAYETGGQSIGINMKTKRGERRNAYLTNSVSFSFPFVRKLIITAPSDAFIFFPGGFGTLHQLFEILTLIETKKISSMPILLYGREFWTPLLEFVHSLASEFKTISTLDEKSVCVVDSPSEIEKYLK